MAPITMFYRLASALSEGQPSVSAGIRSSFPAGAVRSPAWMINFVKGVASDLDDEFYGLAAAPCPRGTHQRHIEILATRKTLGEAIEQGCRYFRSRTDGLAVELTRSGSTCKIVIAPGRQALREKGDLLAEWHAARWHMLIEWLIGDRVPLIGVDFAHVPTFSPREYSIAFGQQCRFGQCASGISFVSDYLDRAVIARSVQENWPVPHLDVTAFAGKGKWHDVLREMLKSRLKKTGAVPTMSEIAGELQVDRRTLLRWLRTEQGCFRDLKAETRLEVVLENLEQGNSSVGELSLIAGFAETRGLARPIKSWTGLTPSEFIRAVGDDRVSQEAVNSRS
jgi:AraC-like DNA-binding protein